MPGYEPPERQIDHDDLVGQGLALLVDLAQGWEPPDGDGRGLVAGEAFRLLREGGGEMAPAGLDVDEADFLRAVEADDADEQIRVLEKLRLAFAS